MPDLNTIVYQLPIEYDADKLLEEFKFILSSVNLDDNHPGIGLSITNKKNTEIENWFQTRNGGMPILKDLTTGDRIKRNFEAHVLGFPGPWRENLEAYYSDGTPDREMIEWHPALLNSEMHRLSESIKEYLNVNHPIRCRGSIMYKPNELVFHSDAHTPWRVHISVKTGEGAIWMFKDETGEVSWHQPPDSVWLIRTGNVMHNVKVYPGSERWQLFYHIWQSNLGPNYHQIA